MAAKSTLGLTHLFHIYEQGWRAVVRAVDLPGTEDLPGFECKSLSLAGPRPHHTSLAAPADQRKGRAPKTGVTSQGDRGLLPCFPLSFCERKGTEAPLSLSWEPQPETPALAEGRTPSEKPRGSQHYSTTAKPGQYRQKEETNASPLLQNFPRPPAP